MRANDEENNMFVGAGVVVPIDGGFVVCILLEKFRSPGRDDI